MTKSKFLLKSFLFTLGLGLASCSQGTVETGLNPQRVVDEARVEQLRNLIIEASQEPDARLFQGDPERVTLIDVAVAFALLQQPSASASDLVATVNLLTGANITELNPTPALADIAAFVDPPGSLDLRDVAIFFGKLQQPNAGANELALLVSNLTGMSVAPADILIVPGSSPPATSALVTTAVDEDGENPAACSLREAIIANNTQSDFGGCGTPMGMITFEPNLGDITLLAEPELITQDVVIDGSGGGLNFGVSGDNQFRVFDIGAGSNVLIQGLTIANGRDEFDSAGLLNSGTLLLEDCNFTANQRGLITTSGSITTIRNCTFSNNQAENGGGLANFGTMTIEDSTFLMNEAVDDNGSGGGGGAIFNSVVSPQLEISGTNFMGNTATLGGGAIQNNGSSLIIQNSQFLDNRALGFTSGEGGTGGAILGGSLTAINNRFSGNQASSVGGSIGVFGNDNQLMLTGNTFGNPTPNLANQDPSTNNVFNGTDVNGMGVGNSPSTCNDLAINAGC